MPLFRSKLCHCAAFVCPQNRLQCVMEAFLYSASGVLFKEVLHRHWPSRFHYLTAERPVARLPAPQCAPQGC